MCIFKKQDINKYLKTRYLDAVGFCGKNVKKLTNSSKKTKKEQTPLTRIKKPSIKEKNTLNRNGNAIYGRVCNH